LRAATRTGPVGIVTAGHLQQGGDSSTDGSNTHDRNARH